MNTPEMILWMERFFFEGIEAYEGGLEDEDINEVAKYFTVLLDKEKKLSGWKYES